MLISVEHLFGWTFAVATEYATADAVMKYMEIEIIHVFAQPRTITSDNATCFTATTLLDTVKQYGLL